MMQPTITLTVCTNDKAIDCFKACHVPRLGDYIQTSRGYLLVEDITWHDNCTRVMLSGILDVEEDL